MAMTLIAIRHGKPESSGYADETLRPLSDEGKTVQKKICEKIEKQGYRPTKIFSSPLRRAHESAAVIGEHFLCSVEMEDALGYDFIEDDLLNLLSSAEPDSVIVFVGHEPTLAKFVNKLVGEPVLPDGLSKSSAAIVRFEGQIGLGNGVLDMYLRP